MRACALLVVLFAVLASCCVRGSVAGSPTCALNGTACPAPHWKPVWNLTLSTVCQPSDTGYFVPPAAQPWGLVSLDWSVARSIWKKPDQNDSTVEATSVEGCRKIKAVSPGTRCFVYHNMELGLQALESQRKVMYNPATADYWLQYTDGAGHKNGTIYNEPGGPGDQFFWDFRVPAAADYYVSSVLGVIADPAVDGTFTDDVTGLPAEHTAAPANMKLSAAEVAAVQQATQATNARLIEAAVAAGKFVWQAFGYQDGVGPAVTSANCASAMASLCAAQPANAPMTMGFNAASANQSVAAFLIARTEIAFLGFGWESDMRMWNEAFLLDVGEPQGGCMQEDVPAADRPGGTTKVFSRMWSKLGKVSLDCASFQASWGLPAAAKQ